MSGLPTNFNAPLPQIQQNLQVPITSPVGSTASVGTSSSQVIGFNAVRRGIIFINSGTATIWIVPGNIAAVAGQGIPVLPGGQQPFFNKEGSNVQYNCSWNAIASEAASPLVMLELL